MGLSKGKTNNLKGRPKGIPNKVTSELREWISKIFDDSREQFLEDLKVLEPYQRLSLLEKLLPYLLPKAQPIEQDDQLKSQQPVTLIIDGNSVEYDYKGNKIIKE